MSQPSEPMTREEAAEILEPIAETWRGMLTETESSMRRSRNMAAALRMAIDALRREEELRTALRMLLSWANTSQYEKTCGLAEHDDVAKGRAWKALQPHQEQPADETA